MHRVINNMKIVRLFSFIILIGAFLSADSNSGNLPTPIPIDFKVDGGTRSVRIDCDDQEAICVDCSAGYDCITMGASCCDALIQHSVEMDWDIIYTCEILETGYYWNCSGCECSAWDNGYNGYGNNGKWDHWNDNDILNGICDYTCDDGICNVSNIFDIFSSTECEPFVDNGISSIPG